MNHSTYQPKFAACAGDGTCGSHVLRSRSRAHANQPCPLPPRTHAEVQSIPLPACAYVVGILALMQPPLHRNTTP
ncbi:MAG: hypothetical protein IT422_18500 [Pirellulaceae bacterium]|nr:hypothetical protein [Pirellulaceae bacterium]